MTENILQIKLFVSSPGDVAKERKSLEEVVAEINQTVGNQHKVSIRTLRWEVDVVPEMGPPQEIINKQIGTYDIYLGIMWKRFGTPTEIAGSGTEEEFNHAYSLRKQVGNLHVLFYFCNNPFFPAAEDEIAQFQKVLQFKKRVQEMGLICNYESADIFPNLVRPHLINAVYDIVQGRQKLDIKKTRPRPKPAHRKIEIFRTLTTHEWREMQVPYLNDVHSSFQPRKGENAQFLQIKAATTPGFVENEWHDSSVFLIRDPVRPYLIQIGETRSKRNKGNPEVIPELTHLGEESLREMYPFISGKKFTWIRMVMAELSTDSRVLDYMYLNDPDRDVKIVAAKNPSASTALMSKECLFCNPDFTFSRGLGEKHALASTVLIIRNDYPYGPYFHYIAIPKAPVHSWEDLTEAQLNDLNLQIWKFLRSKVEAKGSHDHSRARYIDGAPGVNIGFNSSIKHLVLTRHSRASAGASIAHVHKQFWGMNDGPVCLSQHLSALCRAYHQKEIDYLSKYLRALEHNGFVIWDDRNIALYVPIGQISIHEIQVMMKRKATNTYLDLTAEEVVSLSKAEFIATRIFKKLGIKSFNEVTLTESFSANTPTFRLIVAFVTREVDLAVSELNHLYVVDQHPEDTVKSIFEHREELQKTAGFSINENFGCFL